MAACLEMVALVVRAHPSSLRFLERQPHSQLQIRNWPFKQLMLIPDDAVLGLGQFQLHLSHLTILILHVASCLEAAVCQDNAERLHRPASISRLVQQPSHLPPARLPGLVHVPRYRVVVTICALLATASALSVPAQNRPPTSRTFPATAGSAGHLDHLSSPSVTGWQPIHSLPLDRTTCPAPILPQLAASPGCLKLGVLRYNWHHVERRG
jgi:hypothetical protein